LDIRWGRGSSGRGLGGRGLGADGNQKHWPSTRMSTIANGIWFVVSVVVGVVVVGVVVTSS